MEDNFEISQSAGFGSHDNTFVGNMHIHGLTPQEASQIAINLFLENFPKLQEIARETAIMRVEELSQSIINKLEQIGLTDYSAFSDPDVQYTLYEAQKNYARFGSKEMLANLSKLIVDRVNCNGDGLSLKVSIDKAIEVAGLITSQQLDYLSLLFICTRVFFENIKTLSDLADHFTILNNAFPKVNSECFVYLNSLNCLQLSIVDVPKLFAKNYNFRVEDVLSICPQSIKDLTGDYTTSNIGVLLAIANAEAKTPYTFDPHIWISG